MGQAWWRRIQELGLSTDYNDTKSEDGELLKYVFGLLLLPPSEVLERFQEDLMPLKPLLYDDFFDYLFLNYDTLTRGRFPSKYVG